MHNFLVFHCNFTAEDGALCGKQVDQGWITACCHIFCQEHSEEWFKNRDDCPLCQDGHVRLVRMDVSRTASRRRSRTALIGLTPPDFFQAMEVAFNFWVDQKLFEYNHLVRRTTGLAERRKAIETKIQSKLQSLDDNCVHVQAEQQTLERSIEDVARAVKKMREQIQLSKRALAEEEDRYESLKRQLAGDTRRDALRNSGPEKDDLPSRSLLSIRHAGETDSARIQSRSKDEQFGMPSLSKTRPADVLRLGSNIDFGNPLRQRRSPLATMNGTSNSMLNPLSRSNEGTGRVSALTGRMGIPETSLKAPVSTPGLFGSGRVTKRRIT